MKNTYLIILVILCVLPASCFHWETRENTRLLQQAQLLVEQMPDSVLSLLDLVNTFELSASQRAGYTLLRVQARSNAGADLSTDTEIYAVADFFTRKKDPEKAALSCFYAALVAAYQNPKQALKYYQEANDFAQDANNPILQWKILYNMGVLSYDSNWYDVSVTQYRQALKILHQLDNQYQREVRTLNAIANSMMLMSQTDSAHYYYQSALNLIERHNDSALQFMIFNNMGVVYRVLSNLDSASLYNRLALQFSVSDDEKMTANLNLARVYFAQGCLDSTRFFIHQAENLIIKLDNNLKSAGLAKFCFQIEKAAGNYQKALEYLEYYHAHYSELMGNNDRKLLLDMQKKYDIASKENELIKQRNRTLKASGVLLLFLLALAVFSIYMLHTNMKQKEALAKEKLALERSEREKLEKFTEFEISMQQAQVLLEMYCQRDNKMKTMFLEKIGIIKKFALLAPYLHKNAIKDRTDESDIIIKTRDMVNHLNIQNFIDMANELYPDFTVKLKQTYNDLDEREISICCLLLFDFKNQELDLFVNRRVSSSRNTIQTWKSAIRHKLNMDPRGDIKTFLLEKIVKNNGSKST